MSGHEMISESPLITSNNNNNNNKEIGAVSSVNSLNVSSKAY